MTPRQAKAAAAVDVGGQQLEERLDAVEDAGGRAADDVHAVGRDGQAEGLGAFALG
jgi:hypothetical protein